MARNLETVLKSSKRTLNAIGIILGVIVLFIAYTAYFIINITTKDIMVMPYTNINQDA